MSDARIGILTISDRASRGEYEDESGPAIDHLLREILVSRWEPVYRVIPDEQGRIERELIRMADEDGCCLVVTTGGTGPALRDVTPEATEAVCDKILDGFGEQMRAVSLTKVPTAILSPADRRHPRQHPDGQPAGPAARHPGVPPRGLSRDPVLHRSDRRAVPRDRPGGLRRVPAQEEGVGGGFTLQASRFTHGNSSREA